MYIITRLEIITNQVTIIEVFRERIDAINHLHSCLAELSKDDSLDIIILNESRMEVYKRTNGYIYGNYKDLRYVYQLTLHKEQQCVCDECK